MLIHLFTCNNNNNKGVSIIINIYPFHARTIFTTTKFNIKNSKQQKMA